MNRLERLLQELQRVCDEEGREAVVLVSGWPDSLEDCLYYIPRERKLQRVDCNNRTHGFVDPSLSAWEWGGEEGLIQDLERAIAKVRAHKVDLVPSYSDI